jgi:hypothetical protein
LRPAQATKLLRPHFNKKKPDVVAHIINPSYAGDIGRRILVKLDQAKSTSLKNKAKRTGGMAQVVEYLPSRPCVQSLV